VGVKSKREIVAMIERRGGSVRPGTKHDKVFDSDGRFTAVLTSPQRLASGKRRYPNMIAALRAHGLSDD